jgi:hypothetical protein
LRPWALRHRLPTPADVALRDEPIRYKVFGLSLEANADIAGLSRVAPGSDAPDLRLVLQHVPPWLRLRPADASEPFYVNQAPASVELPILSAWTLDSGAFFRLLYQGDVECFIERSGDRAWVFWPSEASRAPHEFLLGFVLGFVLRLRGVVNLHAAAVCGHRAVAIAGYPGVGKSTLAAALGQRGHPVLTDDVAAITEVGGGFLAHPGPSLLRVRRHGAKLLTTSVGPPIVWLPSAEEGCLDLDMTQPGFSQPREAVALGSICLLTPLANSSRPAFALVRPAEALVELLSDTWAARLQDRTMRARELEDVGRVVAGTMLCRLTYGTEDDWVDRACELIERSLLVDDFREAGQR